MGDSLSILVPSSKPLLLIFILVQQHSTHRTWFGFWIFALLATEIFEMIYMVAFVLLIHLPFDKQRIRWTESSRIGEYWWTLPFLDDNRLPLSAVIFLQHPLLRCLAQLSWISFSNRLREKLRDAPLLVIFYFHFLLGPLLGWISCFHEFLTTTYSFIYCLRWRCLVDRNFEKLLFLWHSLFPWNSVLGLFHDWFFIYCFNIWHPPTWCHVMPKMQPFILRLEFPSLQRKAFDYSMLCKSHSKRKLCPSALLLKILPNLNHLLHHSQTPQFGHCWLSVDYCNGNCFDLEHDSSSTFWENFLADSSSGPSSFQRSICCANHLDKQISTHFDTHIAVSRVTADIGVILVMSTVASDTSNDIRSYGPGYWDTYMM